MRRVPWGDATGVAGSQAGSLALFALARRFSEEQVDDFLARHGGWLGFSHENLSHSLVAMGDVVAQVARAKLEIRTFEDAIIKLESEAELYPLRIEHTQKRRDTHQTDLEIVLEEVSRTRVTPPFTGTISEVLVEQGQFVQPGGT